jgi:hypothetical protein
MATPRMDDSWRVVRTQIENIWSEVEFAEQEMKQVRGNLQSMVNLIHQKTGEPRSEILRKVGTVI